jgi:hypothetical protein
MLTVVLFHERGRDLVGYLPTFASESDPRKVAEQFNETYAHGGGWSPMQGWNFEPQSGAITYPGDPPLHPVAAMMCRDELILVYEHAWVAIVQEDRSFEIARMD